jgi:ATP-dependent DNA helicase RecQ
LAKKEKVPAYIIFPDTTLKEMVRKMPATAEEFRRINGVGNVKLEKYGRIFLDVLSGH